MYAKAQKHNYDIKPIEVNIDLKKKNCSDFVKLLWV